MCMHMNIIICVVLMFLFVVDHHLKWSTTTETNRCMKGLFTGLVQGLFAGIELDNKWITEKKQKQQWQNKNNNLQWWIDNNKLYQHHQQQQEQRIMIMKKQFYHHHPL